MKDLSNQPIGLIVTENPAAAAVFERHGMDFCCHGSRTLAAVCREHGASLEAIAAELAAAATAKTGAPLAAADVNAMSLTELVRHIVAVHHTYTKKALPGIALHLDRVIAAHGDRHPELTELAGVFGPLREELEQHLAKEEEILFPYIEALEAASAGGAPLPHACFGEVAQPIAMMEHEHESAGAALARLAALTGNYTPPADGCATYRLLFGELAELERDLHLHIAKENYVLFPKAIELEGSC